MENRRREDNRLNDIQDKVTKVHDAIYGNGRVGLITECALNKQALGRAWKVIYFVVVCLIGGAIKVVWF